GLNVMYFFPTRTDVLEFSKSRVGPLLQDNRFLCRLLHETDTAGLKRIGSSYLYLRGMQSSVGMKSVPADMLVFDELDEATPDSKSLAKERLAHSDFKRVIELSNPSLPSYGIDESYQLSDQRHWTIRCAHCSRWTALDKEFPTRLGSDVRVIRERDGEYYRACPKCGQELDVAAGEWIADFPDRKIHGYRISQLFSSKVDPGEILTEYRRTRFPDRFYNLKIGIPWADTQNKLDEAQVLSCCGEHGLQESSDRSCTMGVDTGKQLHVVISRSTREQDGTREVIYVGARQEYSELDDLMERFCVGTCVIDALPEVH
ncbi:MAG: phage tail protein, partial [bacterium]|nr:phage tail protein [bacterium]